MIFFPMTRVTIVFLFFVLMRFVFFGADEVTDLFSKWPGFSARLKVAASVVVNEIRRHMFSFD